MDLVSRRGLAVLISIVSIPGIFLAIYFGWFTLDRILGSIEVSRFIRDHQTLVAKRLSDPKVHSFSLAHDPDRYGALLIRSDVDDKATYNMLEKDLDEIWQMRFPPQWNTHVRSEEELGNNFGYAARGLGEIAKAFLHMIFAAVASVSLSALYLFFALRRLRYNPIKGAGIDGNKMRQEKVSGTDG